MKTLFSRLNAAIVNPRIAPPVPKSPAEKPERIPPTAAFDLVGFITRFLKIKNNKLKAIKNIPNIKLRT